MYDKKQNKDTTTPTSKKILIASYAIAGALTVLVIIGVFFGFDFSALSIITSAAYAEVGVSNGFYYNKAKKENAMKIAISCVQENPDKAADLAAIISALGGVL